MGIFDSLKNIVANTASNVIDGALNQAKDEAAEAVKEKTEGVIIGGVKNYLNNAKEKVATEDGKEAINVLQDLIDDAENAKKAAIGVSSDGVDYSAKAEEDLAKLAEIADKYNNNQNQ